LACHERFHVSHQPRAAGGRRSRCVEPRYSYISTTLASGCGRSLSLLSQFEYNAERIATKESDLGLLLYDLCVVDCDTREVAKALEARFPELLAAPAVTTKRGIHYYFARSPFSDTAGFFDSHGAVLPDVDFKSRCLSGGRGLVLIPPSTGKSWLRKPWELFPSSGALPEISDALLVAVAAPAHPPITIRVRAAGAAPDAPAVEFTSSVLASASYFQARVSFQNLASGAAAGGEAIDHTLEEGYSVEDIPDLIRLAEGKEALRGESMSACEYDAHLRSLLKLADFLGLQEGAMAALRAQAPGGGRNRADLMRVDAEWASEVIAAAKRAQKMDECTVPGDPSRTLDVVDAETALRTKYVPILPTNPRDHRFLFPDGPRAPLVAGEYTIAPDPVKAAKQALPKFIRTLLRKEAGHLGLAGGAALAALSPPGSRDDTFSDWDLFVYGFNGTAEEVSAQADALARRVMTAPGVEGGPAGCSVTRCAVTFRVFDGESGVKLLVQLILRAAADPADVILHFDLAPAKVMLTYTAAAKPKLVALAAPDWEVSLRHQAFSVDGSLFTRSGPLRIVKYASKGFDVVIPRLTDRALIKCILPRAAATRIHTGDALARFDGFELLLRLEYAAKDQIRSRRMGRWWERRRVPVGPERLQPSDVVKLASKMRMEQRAEYLDSLRARGVLTYVWERAMYAGRRITKMRLGLGVHTLDRPLGWRMPFSPPITRPTNASVADVLRLTDLPQA